jgi:hypothetical protein
LLDGFRAALVVPLVGIAVTALDAGRYSSPEPAAGQTREVPETLR